MSVTGAHDSTTERKLHCSLDDLIEQQQQRSHHQSPPSFRGKQQGGRRSPPNGHWRQENARWHRERDVKGSNGSAHSFGGGYKANRRGRRGFAVTPYHAANNVHYAPESEAVPWGAGATVPPPPPPPPPVAAGSQDLVARLLQLQEQQRSLLLAVMGQNVNSGPAGRRPGPKVRQPVRDPVAAAESAALSETKLIYDPDADETLIVRFKGTDVLKVRKPRGDLILASGGWKTLSTRLVLNAALKPIGLVVEEVKPEGGKKAPAKTVESSKASLELTTERRMSMDVNMEKSEAAATDKPVEASQVASTDMADKSVKPVDVEWRVVDSTKSYLVRFVENLVIGAVGVQNRAQQLARASVIYQHLRQMKSNVVSVPITS